MIVVVVARVLVAGLFVLVVTNVEMEVKEAGAKLPVPMPITGCVQAETADNQDEGNSQNRARHAG